MKKSKKLIASMTAYAVVAALVVPAASAAGTSFSDTANLSGEAQTAVTHLADQNILVGNNGMFDPQGSVTRAQFAKIVALSIGLTVDTTATKSAHFSDVTGWAAGYVDAVKEAGIVDGTGNGFDPNGLVTREQAAKFLVNALGHKLGKDLTKEDATLAFNDVKDDWAKKFVALAAKYDLVKGYSADSFGPLDNANRTQAAVFAYRMINTIKAATQKLALTASATNVAVGQKVQFSVTGTSDAVTYSVDKNGVIDAAGNFVGTAAGAATVTAMVDGKTLTQAITVYGAAAGVKVAAPNALVANGVTTGNLTVTVVDANGNPVSNYSGTVNVVKTTAGTNTTIATGTTQNSDYAAGTGNVTVTNGVGTVVVVAGTVPGVSDTYTASFTPSGATAPVTTTATVSTVAQTATTVKLTAPTSINANANGSSTNGGQGTVSIVVNDQTGNPMLTGTYGLTVHIAGAAQYSDLTTTDKNLSYIGGQLSGTPVVLTAVQGVTGATTVTVSSPGLTTGTATVNSVVAGNPTKLAVANASSTATTNDFVEGSAGQTFTVSTVDANGNPATGYDFSKGTVYAIVTDANGNPATHIKVNSAPVLTASGIQLTSNTIVLTDDAGAANAGKYTLTLKDTAATPLVAASALTFNVTADTVSTGKLSLSAANNYVAASNPNTSFSVQLTDEYGNALSTAGVPVTFTATNSTANSAQGAFNGAANAAKPTVTVNTDATGKATVQFASQVYNNTTWSVAATTATGYAAAKPATVSVQYNVTSALKVTTSDAMSSSASQVTAGGHIAFNVSELDAYGNPVTGENDNVKVTVSNPAAIVWPTVVPSTLTVDTTAGTVTGPLDAVNNFLNGVVAHAAGNVTFTAADTSVSATSASATINVVAGSQTGFALFDATGKIVSPSNQVTVAANTPVALTVKPVDGQGNVVAANAAYNVIFGTLGGGNFSTVSGGAAVPSISFANGASAQTVYYVNATAASYKPTVSEVTSTLSAAITSAQAVATEAVVGGNPGQYTQANLNTLNSAISAAQQVATNTTASQSTVDAAVATLNTAVTTFQGTVVPGPVISNVSIKSSNATSTAAVVNDTVTLTFVTQEQVSKLSSFKIDGNNPDTFTSTGSGSNWLNTATYKIQSTDLNGVVNFAINVKDGAGVYSVTTQATTDGSKVTLSGNAQ